MENLEIKELSSQIEAILFVSGEPVEIQRICDALNIEREIVERALKSLGDSYSYHRRGIRLVQMDTQYQLVSAPEYGEMIRKVFEIRKTAKLSQPTLEVLTIIAYYQPTTRAYIEQVRGVDSAYTIRLLLDRNLIEECGRLQVAGRPCLYHTTQEFLRAFHLSSLDDLPELPEAEWSNP